MMHSAAWLQLPSPQAHEPFGPQPDSDERLSHAFPLGGQKVFPTEKKKNLKYNSIRESADQMQGMAGSTRVWPDRRVHQLLLHTACFFNTIAIYFVLAPSQTS